MSSSLIDRISITTSDECYCAICGVAFEGFLFQNRQQVSGEQPLLAINGYRIGYDPTVVSPADATWVRNVHILGYDSDEDIAFLSGAGRFTAPKTIKLEHQDTRNRDVPFWLKYTCYMKTRESVAVSPFHWPCYEIFLRALFPPAKDPMKLVDIEEVDSLLSSLSNEDCALNLETGAEMRHGLP
ncbi:hypothetical protein F5Y06DRAFT_302669 [Hypoxylon sp. FL0890]|nr:hypothetical protein F5Y06DRAFT_302669 [Hypoxylon sp. FL0890]